MDFILAIAVIFFILSLFYIVWIVDRRQKLAKYLKEHPNEPLFTVKVIHENQEAVTQKKDDTVQNT